MAEKMQTVLEQNYALQAEVSKLQNRLEYRKPVATEKREPAPRSAPMISSQARELSLWESVRLSLDDVTGFLFGRG